MRNIGALAKCNGGWRVEFGFASGREDWPAFAGALFRTSPDAETIAFHHRKSARYCFACYRDEMLVGALFLAPEPDALSRDWAIAHLNLANPRAADLRSHRGSSRRWRCRQGRNSLLVFSAQTKSPLLRGVAATARRNRTEGNNETCCLLARGLKISGT